MNTNLLSSFHCSNSSHSRHSISLNPAVILISSIRLELSRFKENMKKKQIIIKQNKIIFIQYFATSNNLLLRKITRKLSSSHDSLEPWGLGGGWNKVDWNYSYRRFCIVILILIVLSIKSIQIDRMTAQRKWEIYFPLEQQKKERPSEGGQDRKPKKLKREKCDFRFVFIVEQPQDLWCFYFVWQN